MLSPFFFFKSRGALLGRMGARESVPERFAAQALSHARGRAGARARALRLFARIVTEPEQGLDAVAKRRREADTAVICPFVFALVFCSWAPPLGADGSEAGAEVCKRRDPKGAGRVGPAQHPPPYCADNILRKRALPLWEFR